MTHSSSQTKIHLFVLHSPITLLVAQLVIKYLNLTRDQIYIITNSGLYQATLQLTDACNIRFNHAFDNCIAHLNYHGLTAVGQVSLQLGFYEQLHHWISPDYEVNISSLEVFRHIDSPRQQRKFFGMLRSVPEAPSLDELQKITYQLDLLGRDMEVYVPHVNGWMFNHLAHHPNCTAVHIIEEGSLDYVNTMLKPEEWHVELFEQYDKDYPQTLPQYTGFYHYHHKGHFKVSGLRNPRLDLSKCCYFCLNDLAFAYDNCDTQMRKVVLDYKQIPTIQQQDVVAQQLQVYQLLAQISRSAPQAATTNSTNALQPHEPTQAASSVQVSSTPAKNHSLNPPPAHVAPSAVFNQLQLSEHDIARKVNILVLDNLIFADSDNPLFYYEQLITQIKARGIFYFLVKFHPLQNSATRQSIMELIARLQVFAEYLPDDFSLEHLFAHAAPFSVCCHSVGSSVLLYAATMHQLALSYQEILKDDVQYQQLYLDSNYQLRAWLRLAYLRNKQIIAM